MEPSGEESHGACPVFPLTLFKGSPPPCQQNPALCLPECPSPLPRIKLAVRSTDALAKKPQKATDAAIAHRFSQPHPPKKEMSNERSAKAGELGKH